MDSKQFVKRQYLLCNEVQDTAFDICVKAVTEHKDMPKVFTQNFYYCSHYAEMLKIKCYEKAKDIANRATPYS